MSDFNAWFLTLPEGRKAVIRDDKWMLAESAFEAGKRLSEKQTLQYVIDNLDDIWTGVTSNVMDQARIKSKNDGHGYRVVDRESFRAALKCIAHELNGEE